MLRRNASQGTNQIYLVNSGKPFMLLGSVWKWLYERCIYFLLQGAHLCQVRVGILSMNGPCSSPES